MFDVLTTHDQMKFRLIHPDYIRLVYAAVLCYAVLLGLSSFRLLRSKKQTTFCFSVGLTRTQLFFSRFLIGLIGIAATLWIPLVISMIINRAALGGYPGMIRTGSYLLAGLFLQGVLIYTLTVLACTLSGTAGEAALHTLLFLGGFSAVMYSVDRILNSLVWGSAVGAKPYGSTEAVLPGLFARSLSCDPLLFFYSDTCRHAMFYRGLTEAEVPAISPRLLLVWVMITVAAICIALYAFRKRRAEQAEMAGGCRILTGVLILTGGFCVFSIALAAFFETGKGVGITAGLLAVCLYAFVWQSAYLKKLAAEQPQRWFGKWYGNVSTIAVVSMAACLLVSGMGSLDRTRIPDAGDVMQAQLTYVGNPSYMYDEVKGSSSGTSYYMTSEIRYQNQGDVARIIRLHQELQAEGRNPVGKSDEFAKSVVPYDIQISYRMSDGNQKIWYYDRSSLEIMESMLYLDETDTVRKGIRDLLLPELQEDEPVWKTENQWIKEAYQSGAVYLSGIWYDHPYRLDLSEESRLGLLTALAADLSSQDVEDRYFPSECARGVLMFTTAGEEDAVSFSCHLGNSIIYLTDQFTNTLAWLDSHDLTACMQSDPVIESIVLQAYDPSGGDINVRMQPVSNVFLGYSADTLDAFFVQEDFGSRDAITDPGRIEEMRPRLRNTYSLTRPGYLAAVKEKGSDRYVYLYLPEDGAQP